MNFDSLLSHGQNAAPFNWARLGIVTSTGLTIFIAFAAVFVAYQQHVTNKRQLRLALFEKRLAVYESVMKVKGLVIRNARLDLNQLFEFIQETRNYEFLFGEDVSDYIDEIYKKGVEVWARVGNPAIPPAEMTSTTALLEWFSGQEKVARAIFLKYMDFTKP